MLCAALGLYAEDARNPLPYARVLACNEKGRAYLAENRESTQIPLLTKPAAVMKFDENAQRVFALGASAHDLYLLHLDPQAELPLGKDYRKGPSIVQNDEKVCTAENVFV